MPEYIFVSSDDQLNTICQNLASRKIIAVDLEADSMFSFTEKICLIQIAGKDMACIVDPFEISDMSSFLNLLEDPSIVKVFHGSDFDIRSLDRQWGTRIKNLFDTQIACRFLNIEKQGLGDLLSMFFHITVDKRFQKHDWSVRPLPDDMLAYAIGDVTHLIALHDILVTKLKEQKRLSWAEEECEFQTMVRHKSQHNLPLFQKFKGADKMDQKSLAVLENLLLLRLDIAEKKDLPMFKIMSNASLLEMTRKKPQKMEQLTESRILSKKQTSMYGADCLKAIKDAVNLPKEQLPAYPKQVSKNPITGKTQKRIKQLKALRQNISARLQMDPGFVLNNKTITALCLAGSKEIDLAACGMKNWQIQTFGKEILSALTEKDKK